MLKTILIGIVAIVAVMVVLATQQPDTYRVERSVVINAPAERIYAQIIDLQKWPAWSPWAARDPDMQITYSKDTSGMGAWAEWNSETEGQGRQTISSAMVNNSVNIDLEFIAPFEAQAAADFTIVPGANGATLTWGMDGRNDGLVPKVFYLLMDIENMIGSDYDAGLQAIKAIAEQ